MSFPQVVGTYITRIFEDSKLLNIQSLAPFFTESPKSTINSKITQLQKHRHKIKAEFQKRKQENTCAQELICKKLTLKYSVSKVSETKQREMKSYVTMFLRANSNQEQ